MRTTLKLKNFCWESVKESFDSGIVKSSESFSTGRKNSFIKKRVATVTSVVLINLSQ